MVPQSQNQLSIVRLVFLRSFAKARKKFNLVDAKSTGNGGVKEGLVPIYAIIATQVFSDHNPA